MKETEEERRQLEGRGNEGRVGGRKEKKKIPNFISKHVFFCGTNNRTIHDSNWKTYKDRNKTQVMSDHQRTAEMDWCVKYHKERPTLTLLACERALSNRKSWHNQKVSIRFNSCSDEPFCSLKPKSCDQGTPQGHPSLYRSVKILKH